MKPWLVIFIPLLLPGCREAMDRDGRIKPLQPSEFFANGSTARLPVPGTVAQGELREDSLYWRGEVDGLLAGGFPVAVDAAMVSRGEERYNIFCAVCHGRVGDGQGMIVKRGFPAPQTFHQERLRSAPVGYFFGVISHGYGVMPAYGDRVPVPDRWAIIAYLRALQLSQHASLNDVPEEERGALQWTR